MTEIKNANSVIGEGSIISVGAIVDHDVVIGKFCHINSGAIVKAGAEVTSCEKLEENVDGDIPISTKTENKANMIIRELQ